MYFVSVPTKSKFSKYTYPGYVQVSSYWTSSINFGEIDACIISLTGNNMVEAKSVQSSRNDVLQYLPYCFEYLDIV